MVPKIRLSFLVLIPPPTELRIFVVYSLGENALTLLNTKGAKRNATSDHGLKNSDSILAVERKVPPTRSLLIISFPYSGRPNWLLANKGWLKTVLTCWARSKFRKKRCFHLEPIDFK